MLLALTLFAAASPLPAQEDPPHVVFITGDEEYRSEESMPMLATILEHQYGFRCTVLYAQDEHGYIAPNRLDNIPGLEVLADADLLVQFTRFRALPAEQLQHILDYAQSGRPMVGFRTSTHAFLYPEGSPFREWNDGFGRDFFGQKWITHHGHQSTTGVTLREDQAEHPILRGVDTFFASSWLYHVEGGGDALPDDATVLATGTALGSHYLDKREDRYPLLQPVAWTRLREGKQRIFFTTLGHPEDFTWGSMRKLS
ncbi:MAG: ThuA domain-containing protein, partial [Planctomycetota bacterium]